MGPDCIKVFVRVRPANAKEETEAAAGFDRVVHVDEREGNVVLKSTPPRSFTFDCVFGEGSTQDTIFEKVGAPLIPACLDGYNGSIYVYGQTGAGKTYTITGPPAGPSMSMQSMHTDSQRGIICRLIAQLFAEIEARRSEEMQYLCRCSYLEIYHEQISDLLEPSNTGLHTREDLKRGVYVDKLTEQTAWSAADAFGMLRKGMHHRHVGATYMNEHSSRSHAVFMVTVESQSTSNGVTSTKTARLNLVDLAGSERQHWSDWREGNSEMRVKEAGSINKSLSALTNVIMSLSRAARPGGKQRTFVHYRDSRLTFLLRDSLGGNSKTVIVAGVSPSALCFGETLSTLKFAARAKKIRCAAVVNEEYTGTVESLTAELMSLKKHVAFLSQLGVKRGVGGVPELGNVDRSADSRHVRRLEILLARALERANLAEARSAQLKQFAQFLEDHHWTKDRYIEGVRAYHQLCCETLSVATARHTSPGLQEVVDKFLPFRQTAAPERPALTAQQAKLVRDLAPDVYAAWEERLDRSEEKDRGQVQRARRGTPPSQSTGPMRRSTSLGSLRADEPRSERPEAMPSGTALDAEENRLLREENRRLRQQLDAHPELARLMVENRLLREKLSSFSRSAQRPLWAQRTDESGSSLMRTERSTVLTPLEEAVEDLNSPTVSPKSPVPATLARSPVAALTPLRSPGGLSLTSPGSNSKTTLSTALSQKRLEWPGEPATSPMSDLGATQISSSSEASSDDEKEHVHPKCLADFCAEHAPGRASVLATSRLLWDLGRKSGQTRGLLVVFAKKMAQELEVQLGEKADLLQEIERLREREPNGDKGAQRAATVEERGERVTATQLARLHELVAEGAQVAQRITQDKTDALLLHDANVSHAGPFGELDVKASLRTGLERIKKESHSCSAPSLDKGFQWRRDASQALARTKSTVSLHSINESMCELHPWPQEPAPPPPSGDMESLERAVRGLTAQLRFIDSSYTDLYDQFQQLSEEYENRVEECRFYELQCHKLNMSVQGAADGKPFALSSLGSPLSLEGPLLARTCVHERVTHDRATHDQVTHERVGDPREDRVREDQARDERVREEARLEVREDRVREERARDERSRKEWERLRDERKREERAREEAQRAREDRLREERLREVREELLEDSPSDERESDVLYRPAGSRHVASAPVLLEESAASVPEHETFDKDAFLSLRSDPVLALQYLQQCMPGVSASRTERFGLSPRDRRPRVEARRAPCLRKAARPERDRPERDRPERDRPERDRQDPKVAATTPVDFKNRRKVGPGPKPSASRSTPSFAAYTSSFRRKSDGFR